MTGSLPWVGTSEKADGEVKVVVGGGFANWLIEMPGTAVDLGFEWSPVLSIKSKNKC